MKEKTIEDKNIELVIEIERLNNIINELEKEYDKEIERLNNVIDKKEQFLGDNIKRLEREVVKRDNIINELENYLNEQVDYMIHHSIERMVAFDCCRHKLQELKGSDK